MAKLKTTFEVDDANWVQVENSDSRVWDIVEVAPGEGPAIVEQMSEANQQWVAGKAVLSEAIRMTIGNECHCEDLCDRDDGVCSCCELRAAFAAAVPEESDADTSR